MDRKDAQSFEELLRLAREGNAAAQQWVALAYLEGWGGTVDRASALGWYSKAAEKDDPGGHFGMAVMHVSGWGVRKDPVEAYMRFILMRRRRGLLRGRWGDDTTKRMLDSMKKLEAKLTPAEREEAERRAEEWQWQRRR